MIDMSKVKVGDLIVTGSENVVVTNICVSVFGRQMEFEVFEDEKNFRFTPYGRCRENSELNIRYVMRGPEIVMQCSAMRASRR
jgi:hypothetical protein